MSKLRIANVCARDGCGHLSNQHLMIDIDNTDIAHWLDCGCLCANVDCKCLQLIPSIAMPYGYKDKETEAGDNWR